MDLDSLLNKKSNRMPVIFVGHGSPMNAIEQSEFSKTWQHIGKSIQKPKAILCISAHWETKGSFITAMDNPKTIHDFGGFPCKLFQVQYPAKGDPNLAQSISETIQETIELDLDWGLDHGSWSILVHMFPEADVPVIQLSLDYTKSANEHYKLGQILSYLRDQGILVIGSGNIVHNLRKMYVEDGDFNKELAHEWACNFNNEIKKHIIQNDHQTLIDYKKLSDQWRLSIPTMDHYIPLLYVLGMQNPEDELSFFNDKIIVGAISMTSFMYK